MDPKWPCYPACWIKNLLVVDVDCWSKKTKYAEIRFIIHPRKAWPQVDGRVHQCTCNNNISATRASCFPDVYKTYRKSNLLSKQFEKWKIHKFNSLLFWIRMVFPFQVRCLQCKSECLTMNQIEIQFYYKKSHVNLKFLIFLPEIPLDEAFLGSNVGPTICQATSRAWPRYCDGKICGEAESLDQQ